MHIWPGQFSLCEAAVHFPPPHSRCSRFPRTDTAGYWDKSLILDILDCLVRISDLKSGFMYQTLPSLFKITRPGVYLDISCLPATGRNQNIPLLLLSNAKSSFPRYYIWIAQTKESRHPSSCAQPNYYYMNYNVSE